MTGSILVHATNQLINEDLSHRVMVRYKEQMPKLTEARSNGKMANRYQNYHYFCYIYKQNMFTSELKNKNDSGLLVHDITDPFPVFALCHYTAKHNSSECSNKCIRHLSNEKISALTHDLM